MPDENVRERLRVPRRMERHHLPVPRRDRGDPGFARLAAGKPPVRCLQRAGYRQDVTHIRRGETAHHGAAAGHQLVQGVAFSLPYGEHQDVVVGKAGEEIKDFADLKNQRVGVTRGTISEQVLQKQKIPDLRLVRLENDSASLAALATGQVDPIGTADVLAAELIKRCPDQKFQVKFAFRKGYFGIGLRRGDPDFQRWLNTFVFFNMANGRLSAISKKWTGVACTFLPTF